MQKLEFSVFYCLAFRLYAAAAFMFEIKVYCIVFV